MSLAPAAALVDWPTRASLVVAGRAPPVRRGHGDVRHPSLCRPRIDRILTHTVSIAGLTGVVVAVYLVIVAGPRQRAGTARERSLLVLSMVAAAVAALLYGPARQRLGLYANRIVYGEREAPDAVLRTFGSRLSRAIPMDELLLQVAESLRKTLALTGRRGLDRLRAAGWSARSRSPTCPSPPDADRRRGVGRRPGRGHRHGVARVCGHPASSPGRESCVVRGSPRPPTRAGAGADRGGAASEAATSSPPTTTRC